MVNEHGHIIAEASGVPPEWIRGIPGAEAWALLQAMSLAVPGTQYRSDCKPCVDLLRGPRDRAVRPGNSHARVMNLLFAANDDGSNQDVVWVPAHTTELDVGRPRLGDGSLLTRTDREANDRADTLAKAQAAVHRPVPRHIREQVTEHKRATAQLVQWVGIAAWEAGNLSLVHS